VFQGLGQAKFPDGGSVLGLNQFSILHQLPQKKVPHFKSGKNQPKHTDLSPLF